MNFSSGAPAAPYPRNGIPNPRLAVTYAIAAMASSAPPPTMSMMPAAGSASRPMAMLLKCD